MNRLIGHRAMRWLMTVAVVILAYPTVADTTNSAWFTRVWQTENGLPDNQLTGIAQTPDGFLWVGTPNGLVRFDGVQFEEVPLANSAEIANLPHRIVDSLFYSHDGRLWIGFGGKIAWLDPLKGDLMVMTNLQTSGYVRQFSEDAEGAIWVVCAGNDVMRVKNGQLIPFASADDWIRSRDFFIASDDQKQIWFGRGRQLGVFRGGRFEVLRELPQAVTAIGPRRAGGVWVCLDTRLLECAADGNWQDLGTFGAAASHSPAVSVLEDSKGTLWIGTSGNGLIRYADGKFESVPTSHNHVWKLFEDREGNIWAGTGGGGLNKLCRRVIESEGESVGLQIEGVRSLCEDRQGKLWGATQSGALVCRENGRWKKALTDQNELGNVACVAADSRGAVWISLNSGGVLYRWQNDKLSTWRRTEGIKSSGIRVLLPSADGSLWIGGNTPRSLQRMQDDRLEDFELPSGKGVRALIEDAQGNLWLATTPDGLWRLNRGEFYDETAKLPRELAYRSIQCLYKTQDDSIWVGFFNGELGRLKDGRVSVVNQAQGLFEGSISQIIEDGRGWLWLGTQQGIFRIKLEELNAVADGQAKRLTYVRYDKSDGLRSTQASRDYFPGAIRTREGRIWMPMRAGLAVIRPDNEPRDTKPPQVLVKKVTMDGRSVATYGGALTVGGQDKQVVDLNLPGRTLRLPPSYRKLEFEFAALSYVAPDKINFRYRLKNFDADWIAAGTTRRASYPRLAAGSYRFQVAACNYDGEWNDAAPEIAFIVEPFLWEIWWVRAAVVVAIVSFAIGMARYIWFRRFQKKLRLLEQRDALHKERARIAKDLHDDLGANLTQIALLSELAQSDYDKPTEAKAHLDNVFRTANSLTRSLDEIIWAVNPKNDTLDEFVTHLCNFAQGFLSAAGLRCRWDIPVDLPREPLPSEVAHHLYLAVKETLHNVVKHAQAKEVWIRLRLTETALNLVVEDDGKGFSSVTARIPERNGLINLNQRMKDIGGNFEQSNRPPSGTSNVFTVPFKLERRN